MGVRKITNFEYLNNKLKLKRELTYGISSITGVLVQERDLTNIIHASTSIGAVAGEFEKPVDEIVSISSEQELVDTFGKPDSTNFEIFSQCC